MSERRITDERLDEIVAFISHRDIPGDIERDTMALVAELRAHRLTDEERAGLKWLRSYGSTSLHAECEAMRMIVEATCAWRDNARIAWERDNLGSAFGTEQHRLCDAIDAFRARKP